MTRPAEDRSEAKFSDFKHAYNRAQAVAEANRCLYCEDAPCIAKCPTAIDIPEFIRKIATDNLKGSARTIFSSNILGMSCARVCPVEVLCVGDCVYNGMDAPPIQIGKLQRYATDIAFEEGWTFFEAGEDTGKSVGLVGGGPASLACAHELRKAGHAVTIYEKRSVIGGLNSTGVAPYKMRADRAMEEAEWILGIGGIDVKTGIEIGLDLTLQALEERHDAVFFGAGLGPDRMLEVPGRNVAGVHGAVDWIEAMKLGRVSLVGVTHAVVLGGGNTAIDAVRELLGLGVPCVTMAYRGDEARMSGYQHEWSEAKREGARGAWRAQPVGFESAKGVVTGVRCEVLDADKKPTGRHHVEPAELVLVAIGQGKLGAMLAGLEGVQVDGGRVVTDEHGATGRPGFYAGGDAANGGKEVVNAAAEGMRAARAIDAYLGGDRG
jgi:dihydropyrimidine dehydrogenase (NAD+) subunit PreT